MLAQAPQGVEQLPQALQPPLGNGAVPVGRQVDLHQREPGLLVPGIAVPHQGGRVHVVLQAKPVDEIEPRVRTVQGSGSSPQLPGPRRPDPSLLQKAHRKQPSRQQDRRQPQQGRPTELFLLHGLSSFRSVLSEDPQGEQHVGILDKAVANKIVVLSEGRVVEQGAPSELYAKENGVFRRMASLQGAN